MRIYDATHLFFSRMSSRLKLKFGSWEKPQVSGTAPSRRFGHSTVVVEDVMYVFGGSSYGENENTLYHNDMYTLKCKIYSLFLLCGI